MDKEFVNKLAERTGHSRADIDALVDGLAVVLAQSCAELDEIAVPTFGNFKPVKHKEEIITDLSTGKRMLLPPEVTLEFTPSGALRNRLTPPEQVL